MTLPKGGSVIYALTPHSRSYASLAWARSAYQAQEAAFPDLFKSVSRAEQPRLAGEWNSEWELLNYNTTLDAEAEGFEVPNLPFGNCATFSSMLGSFIVCLDEHAYEAFKPFIDTDSFETLGALFDGKTVKVVHVRNICPPDAMRPNVIAKPSASHGRIHIGESVKQALEAAGVTGIRCTRVPQNISARRRV